MARTIVFEQTCRIVTDSRMPPATEHVEIARYFDVAMGLGVRESVRGAVFGTTGIRAKGMSRHEMLAAF